MAKIQGESPEPDIPAPDINPEKICYVIAKARELEAEDEGIEADESNPTDDESTYILTDEAYDTIRQELAAFIEALDADEKSELVALTWTGRGDYGGREWRAAVADARARQEMPTSDYLLGIPLLSAYLEAGMAEFDLACTAFDAGNYG